LLGSLLQGLVGRPHFLLRLHPSSNFDKREDDPVNLIVDRTVREKTYQEPFLLFAPDFSLYRRQGLKHIQGICLKGIVDEMMG